MVESVGAQKQMNENIKDLTKAQFESTREQTTAQSESMRELIEAQAENTREMTKAQNYNLTDKHFQELNSKVDSLDQKLGMLVELFMK